MRKQQIAWILWVAGTVVIVGSWMGVVTPAVGWIGFVVAGIGALISWIPTAADRSGYPLTQEGLPVEPSGAPLPPDMGLEPGMPLLAYSRGKWWRATVIAPQGDGAIVRFPGWDTNRVERIPRRMLQIDPDPNRKPIALSDVDLERWQEKPRPDETRVSGEKDGIQG
jgi:hypothetical protein